MILGEIRYSGFERADQTPNAINRSSVAGASRHQKSCQRQPNDLRPAPSGPPRRGIERSAQLPGKPYGDLILHDVHCNAMQGKIRGGFSGANVAKSARG